MCTLRLLLRCGIFGLAQVPAPGITAPPAVFGGRGGFGASARLRRFRGRPGLHCAHDGHEDKKDRQHRLQVSMACFPLKDPQDPPRFGLSQVSFSPQTALIEALLRPRQGESLALGVHEFGRLNGLVWCALLGSCWCAETQNLILSPLQMSACLGMLNTSYLFACSRSLPG